MSTTNKGEVTMQTEAEVRARLRENRFKNWTDLLRACRAQHNEEMKGRAGGAVMCVCGHGCGGCGACSMLKDIISVFHYMPTAKLPKEWRQRIEEMRELM